MLNIVGNNSSEQRIKNGKCTIPFSHLDVEGLADLLWRLACRRQQQQQCAA
jgi:hypothetical protein